MNTRPKTTTVMYRNTPWELDLVACRRAFVWRQADGDFQSMAMLGAAVGRSRSTVSRFFSGRPTSLGVTLAILSALKVKFLDIAQPVGQSDRPEAPRDGRLV